MSGSRSILIGPPVGAADADGLLMLTAHPQLGRGKKPVDDEVVLPHAIIDELTVALGTDDQQRRCLALGDAAGQLDIDL